MMEIKRNIFNLFKKRAVNLILPAVLLAACSSGLKTNTTDIAEGWSANSINTVIFRRNSVVSSDKNQYAAFYDTAGYVILARRSLGSTDWEIRKTRFKGNVLDAHNSISIMIDGAEYLHMVWNEHNSELHYCVSKEPEGLELTEINRMTGKNENSVSYPQFFKLRNGDLIFVYRDGESGNGNLVVNHYDTGKKTWTMLHDNLIDGEGKRNAYWQLDIDDNDVIHLSWVWRETPDVASNHDICYARSKDGGKTWEKSNGEKYAIPITLQSAEYAAIIPQKSELINQTSMCADKEGKPCIVNYWTPEGSNVPQYHLVYNDGKSWHVKQISQLTTPFSLSGAGTKRIPISRPLILCDKNNSLYLIYRSSETGNRITLSVCKDGERSEWESIDITDFSVGMWEPTYDTEQWRNSGILNLFVQKVGQGDAETIEKIPPQTVSVLEVNNLK